jgi:hypothetical protein
LRRIWPQWRDALVLVQPATVEHWRRDWCNRRWWRRSRRPGRPRIDAGCLDLIGRLAEENALWGAPRIHGELLKLGVIVSERTVSRYLRERPKRPSQTWRTLVAKSPQPVLIRFLPAATYAPDADDADVSCLPCRQPRSSRDALHAPSLVRAQRSIGGIRFNPPQFIGVPSKIALTTASRFETEAGAARRHRAAYPHPCVHVQKNDWFL